MAGASKMKKPAAQDKALPEQGSEGNGGLPAEGKLKPSKAAAGEAGGGEPEKG